ncbi:41170_t:CDS:2, partial [Gigaspora margarita]
FNPDITFTIQCEDESEIENEAIKDIKTSFGRVSDAINTMAKKYHISVSRAKEYIENRECKQQMLDLNRHCSTGPLEATLQIKKRRSKPKYIQVSDLSTISDTKLEQVLNE